jgi:hypothetical protein
MIPIQDVVVLPPNMAYYKALVMTRALLHQNFDHVSDDILDRMCHDQTMSGFHVYLLQYMPMIVLYIVLAN